MSCREIIQQTTCMMIFWINFRMGTRPQSSVSLDGDSRQDPKNKLQNKPWTLHLAPGQHIRLQTWQTMWKAIQAGDRSYITKKASVYSEAHGVGLCL